MSEDCLWELLPILGSMELESLENLHDACKPFLEKARYFLLNK